MKYKVFADILVLIHFAWILFMLAGFILAIAAFFKKGLFELWLFRLLHLAGILYVGILSFLGRYCPLTIWENSLRLRHDPGLAYRGSFIIHHLERIVYPEVNPAAIQIPTLFFAVFTLIVFIARPPKKIKNIFLRK